MPSPASDRRIGPQGPALSLPATPPAGQVLGNPEHNVV